MEALSVYAMEPLRRRRESVCGYAWGDLGPGRGRPCVAPGAAVGKPGVKVIPPSSPAPGGAGRSARHADVGAIENQRARTPRPPLPGLGNFGMTHTQRLASPLGPAGRAQGVGLRTGLHTSPPPGGQGELSHERSFHLAEDHGARGNTIAGTAGVFGRTAAAAFVFLSLLLGVMGCSGPRNEEEKLARIEELYRSYRKEFPKVPEITAGELQAAMAREKVVLVDVREPAEREVSVIPGAVSREQFEAKPPPASAGPRIVVYCTIGYRSGLFARQLAEKGLLAANLKGGILSWVHAGQDVADASGPTRRIHVYGKKWDLAPDGCETVAYNGASR